MFLTLPSDEKKKLHFEHTGGPGMPCSPEMPTSPLGPWWREEKNRLISYSHSVAQLSGYQSRHIQTFSPSCRRSWLCVHVHRVCPQKLCVGQKVRFKPAYDGSCLNWSLMVIDRHVAGRAYKRSSPNLAKKTVKH